MLLGGDQTVWMSHFDSIVQAPPGFTVTASTPDAIVAALENVARRIYAVQFHPEVVHTPHGQEMLRRFLFDVCDCTPTWTMASIIDTAVARCVPRSAALGPSAGCRVGSTRPSRPPSCTVPSATNSRASTSTPG